MPDSKIDITPDTKVGALLDAYPELEEKLIELAPAFGKLRNPILRKTVGKVATLRQAAQVGGVSLGTIITTLRREAGLESTATADGESTGGTAQPTWFSREKIAQSFDARPMLESGQHPITVVMKHLDELPTGGIYELITPFVPAPLLDMAAKKGFESWSVTEGTDCVKSYLTRK
jgi:uncharacterized protein (DUF2249 family)